MPQPLLEIYSMVVPEFEITLPSSVEFPAIKGLLGIWSGFWDRILPAILIVSDINTKENSAKVIFAWGNHQNLGFKKGFIKRPPNLFRGKSRL